MFTRGSQFKVESLMFRIAKPECFMLVSPSRGQVRLLLSSSLLMDLRNHLGRKPKCAGMLAACHGADVQFLHESSTCTELSVFVSISDDCVQLLLFDLLGKNSELEGTKQAWLHRLQTNA